MINTDKFRPNVGIIITNEQHQVLWAHRTQQDGWQFPQGGIETHETIEQAMYRELQEELGLSSTDVSIRGYTKNWLRYHFPKKIMHRKRHPVQFIGQKQRWFLLRLISNEVSIRLDCTKQPEFDRWVWVNYWDPLGSIVAFKRNVYRLALIELEPLLIKS